MDIYAAWPDEGPLIPWVQNGGSLPFATDSPNFVIGGLTCHYESAHTSDTDYGLFGCRNRPAATCNEDRTVKIQYWNDTETNRTWWPAYVCPLYDGMT